MGILPRPTIDCQEICIFNKYNCSILSQKSQYRRALFAKYEQKTQNVSGAMTENYAKSHMAAMALSGTVKLSQFVDQISCAPILDFLLSGQ